MRKQGNFELFIKVLLETGRKFKPFNVVKCCKNGHFKFGRKILRWPYSQHILNFLAIFILNILIKCILIKKACMCSNATRKVGRFLRHYFETMGSSRKKLFMGGGGYILFSMIYPWTFPIFTPWTWVVPMDNHQFNPLDTKIYPWTGQIYPLDIAILRVFPGPLDNSSSTPHEQIFSGRAPYLENLINSCLILAINLA